MPANPPITAETTIPASIFASSGLISSIFAGFGNNASEKSQQIAA
jgi:hypothetical protein